MSMNIVNDSRCFLSLFVTLYGISCILRTIVESSRILGLVVVVPPVVSSGLLVSVSSHLLVLSLQICFSCSIHKYSANTVQVHHYQSKNQHNTT